MKPNPPHSLPLVLIASAFNTVESRDSSPLSIIPSDIRQCKRKRCYWACTSWLGKTGAFLFHTACPSRSTRPEEFFAFALSSTRELAIQISEQFEALGTEIGVKCAVLVGGFEMVQQLIKIAQQPLIIVGTPNRILDHLKGTKGFTLSRLKYLDCYLVYILTEMAGSMSIVFTRRCDSTQLLALTLRNLGLKAIPINVHMS